MFMMLFANCRDRIASANSNENPSNVYTTCVCWIFGCVGEGRQNVWRSNVTKCLAITAAAVWKCLRASLIDRTGSNWHGFAHQYSLNTGELYCVRGWREFNLFGRKLYFFRCDDPLMCVVSYEIDTQCLERVNTIQLRRAHQTNIWRPIWICVHIQFRGEYTAQRRAADFQRISSS